MEKRNLEQHSVVMLSRPLTLTETEDRGCGLEAETLPPVHPLAEEDSTHAGVFSLPVPPSLSSPPLPAPRAPCCSCSSLLPRLLAAHRLEVRRLLRGALTSLGHRLDFLERRSRRHRKKKRSQGEGSPTFTCSSAFLTPVPPGSISSSSSNSNESPSSFSQSEQRKRLSRRRRRRGRRHEGSLSLADGADGDEEEEGGRFVGRMAVSFRGRGEEQESLILHDFSQQNRRNKGGASQSEKAVDVFSRRNGYSSHNVLLVLQTVGTSQSCSQTGVFAVFPGQWHFSDVITRLSNHSDMDLWLSHTPSHINPTPVLHLSAFAMEAMVNWVRGKACWSPLWPLRDRTAPPSLDSDHCYVQRPTESPTVFTWRQQKRQANHKALSLRLSRRRILPLPSCSANGLSAALPTDQSAAFFSTNVELGKRVSQIRIRRASPKEMLLTPMGLPKVKRLKKKEFSLEEIYTNKNFESPHINRSLETIFEVPREKDGALLLIGQQKRRRLLLFPDFTQPRKRKRPQGAGLPIAMAPRKRATARRQLHSSSLDGGDDPDVMLVERLSSLEDFLTQQGLDV